MPDYPEPPPAVTPLDNLQRAQAAAEPREEAPPQLPSRAWPWLIGLFTIAAMILQIYALLGLLDAETSQSQFDARVAAWDEAVASRREAVDEWDRIEAQARGRIDQIREQSNSLQGTVEAIQKQHDQLSASVASEAKTLAFLETRKADVATQLKAAEATIETGKLEQQQLVTAIETAKAALSDQMEENATQIELGRTIKTALTKIEVSQAAAEKSLATQQRLVAESEQKLKETEDHIAQMDRVLDDRIKAVAQLRLQQETSKQLAIDLAALRNILQASKTELAKLDAEDEAANSRVQTLSSDVTKLTEAKRLAAETLAALEKQIADTETRLAAQRKAEQAAAVRVAEMTKAMNEATEKAAISLSQLTKTAAATITEMSERAEDVREAIRRLKQETTADSNGRAKDDGQAAPDDDRQPAAAETDNGAAP